MNYREHVRTQRSGDKWIGVVCRRREVAQVMSVDDTMETVWCSQQCDSEEAARQLAEARVQDGPPWT